MIEPEDGDEFNDEEDFDWEVAMNI